MYPTLSQKTIKEKLKPKCEITFPGLHYSAQASSNQNCMEFECPPLHKNISSYIKHYNLAICVVKPPFLLKTT